MSKVSRFARGAHVVIAVISGCLSYESVSLAQSSRAARSVVVDDLAADIARIETALQRHRDPAGSPPAAEVTADTPGILRRAENTLQFAALLRARWRITVDSAMLQREFERMRRESARPAWLAELVDALGRDETRVARALVAPALTANLALQKFQSEGKSLKDWDSFLAHQLPPPADGVALAQSWRVSLFDAETKTPETSGNDSATLNWRSGGLLRDGRDGGGAWTGSAYLLWNGDALWIYNPATDTWRLGNSVNQPVPTIAPSVQWTGTKLFVWGGQDPSRSTNRLNVGGMYDPVADSWSSISTTNSPAAQATKTVWTGNLVIGFGETIPNKGTGRSCPCSTFYTAGGTYWTYSPATNSWETSSTLPPAGAGGQDSALAWTGTEMLVWGGTSSSPDLSGCAPFFPVTYVGAGSAYNPTTRTWRALPPNGLQARTGLVGVWTGTEWIIWGGNSGGTTYYDGAIYNPSTNTWRPVGNTGAPQLRPSTAVWTGSEMLVRGTDTVTNDTEAGARYNPTTDTWSTLTTPTFATGRHVAWTGSEALYPLGLHGGRYNPGTDSWQRIYPVTPGATPRDSRFDRSGAVGFTGAELLVWGGFNSQLGQYVGGERFNLATATWSPMSSVGAPDARGSANSVWTGTEWLIQGGTNAAGGRYSPATDTWAPMSQAGEPGTSLISTVWTGSEFVLWYGATGAKYRPATDQWVPMRTTGAPPRGSIAWLGSRMMAWTPGSFCPPFGPPPIPSRGALYDPIADLWVPITTRADEYGSDQLIAVGHGGVKIDGVRLVYDGLLCTPQFQNLTASPYDPSSNTWGTSIGDYYRARSAVHVWDRSGIFRDGGSYYELFFTDPLSGERCTRDIAVRDRARINLATRTVEVLALASPLSWSTTLKTFWTGTDVLHFDTQSGYGAFYDPGLDPAIDADGDGVGRGNDCDDADSTTHPGATEVCDFRDNDCDGSVDEGTDIDRDGDGFGACTNDCDDFAASTHPGATELCDNVDNDCNGLIDEGAGADADGDGFNCHTDCDDTRPTVYPGAPELCDGLDNDCDSTIDEGAGTDNDADGHFSCNDDCNDSNNTIYKGAPELCDALDNDCDSTIDEGAGVDSDGDGHSSCNDDCNDSSSSVWKKPGNFSSLTVQGKPVSVISWSDMKPSWGNSSVYDVVRGRVSQLLAARAYTSAQCMSNNRVTNSITDGLSVPIGDSFYYFVRGQNSCGSGTYGTTARDTSATACP